MELIPTEGGFFVFQGHCIERLDEHSIFNV